MIELPRNQILIGDARQQLAELPDASVDAVITSPPYFALRDYGHPGQLGLETDIAAWVAQLQLVCDEVQRVLKPGGGFWLNLGDSYSQHPREGAPKKSLLMGPSRLALALISRDWLLRNHVIWAKSNPMPSSVRDRLSNTHESLYFFTRSAGYFFDLNAIREPHKQRRANATRKGGQMATYPPAEALPRRPDRPGDVNDGLARLKAAGLTGHPLGGNPGDVWTLGTASYHGEHFATFPVRLAERPLLASCPERVCSACGQPWQHAKQHIHDRWLAVGPLRPGCQCRADWRPGVVLDPFMGSGTVAVVAEKHRRDWLGIELNPAYAKLAQKRLQAARAERETTAKPAKRP
jgi:site-specific DNA-methyltransferase (adenine-specific)